MAEPLQVAVMSTVAEQLRRGREAQKLTTHQVADVIKIRADHVVALEEGNYNVFSAPVYIRGFVRTYATMLKLNVPQVMAALDEELSQTDKFSEPPPLTDQPRGVLEFLALWFSKLNQRRGRIGIGAGLAVALILIVYFAMRTAWSSDPLADLKPGVYRGGQDTAGETLPLPTPAPRR